MLTRSEIFDIIEKERLFQDTNYKPDEKLSSGATRRERDLDVASHLVLLDVTLHLVLLSIYLRKAEEAWNVKGDNKPALQQIAKMAAIAVRALEQAGASEALKQGLR